MNELGQAIIFRETYMCGIAGVVRNLSGDPNDSRAAQDAALMLQLLQHRGSVGAGLVSACGEGKYLLQHRGLGLVSHVLTPHVCEALTGNLAIAQTRYPTAGQKDDPNPSRNLGPLYGETRYGRLAVAHNGNLIGGEALREELKNDGSVLQTGIDTEVLLHRIARSKQATLTEAILEVLRSLPLAYAFLIMSEDRLYVVRDRLGVRPLMMARAAGCTLFASETAAFDAVPGIDRDSYAEVPPGELLVFGHRFRERYPIFEESSVMPRPRRCLFEYVYFARPNSDGGRVLVSRVAAGRLLATRAPVPPGSIIVGVPDSGLAAASGFAEASGEQLVFGLVRDHNQGRAFMRPTPSEREHAVRLKHSVVEELVRGKVVVLVDDSLVRGPTAKGLIKKLLRAGVLEVHVRIASPEVRDPCHYGIDTPRHDELFAHNFKTCEEMAAELGATSVRFLALPDLIEAVSTTTGVEGFCTACFDGILLSATA